MPASRPTSHFAEALDSVLGQSIDDFEVIVTDDSDGELEPILRKAADARIRYVVNEGRLGLAKNHEKALEQATGAAVAFLHDDDVWCPNYLEEALAALDRDEQIGLVLTDMVEMDDHGRVLRHRPSRMPPGPVSDPLSHFLDEKFRALIPSASLFRRAALNSGRRPLPDLIAGDLTMYIDCVASGWNVYHLAEPLVRYRIHAGQSSHNRLDFHTALVTIFDSYRFTDAAHERQRIRRINRALIARSADRLRADDPQGARLDLRASRRRHPRQRALWAMVIQLLSYLPPSLFRSMERMARHARQATSWLRRT